MKNDLSRRDMLLGSGTVAAVAAATWTSAARADQQRATDQITFRYCLNTSTIRGQKLSVPKQIEVAAQAGYDALELWTGDLHQFVKQGGQLKDVRKQLEDAGVTVESAIGFAKWIVDDDAAREQGLAQAKTDMGMLAEIGGKRIAAPPAGATSQADLDLRAAARRYRALLELGDRMGVVPQIECWGPSQCLSRLSEIAFVAIESGHPQACLLPDVYHLYRGGSDFAGLGMLSGTAVQVFHMNDYPDSPPREQLGDGDRVYPGDGAAPLTEILNTLRQNGFRGHLSLELFNRDYWQQDPLQVARTGLEKMREAVAKSQAA